MNVLINELVGLLRLLVLAWIPVGVIALIIVLMVVRFRQTDYYHLTHNGFFKTHSDKELYGEYLVYRNLKALPGPRRFLFNVYIPIENGATTEVDVILLHTSGIYVFESKNYSGWIFGTETQYQWTQSLPAGNGTRKSHFLNPIIQNDVHIRWLKAALSPYGEFPYHSFILFSDRCKLKKIQMTSSKAAVIHRSGVRERVRKRAAETGFVLDAQQIQQIYEKLYPYTQVSEQVKRQHIEQIHKKYAPVKPTTPAAMEHTTPKITQIQEPNIQNTAAETAPTSSNSPTCPRCGKPLVLRVARSGAHAGQSFWGCSGFPKCRYTQHVSVSDPSAKQ